MVAKLFQITIPANDPPTTNRNTSEKNNAKLIDNVNQIRAGNRRLPTPEKSAILELSDSFERRRLGKHQQMLHDISQRCREQEVADLSMNLTTKCHQMQQRQVKNEIAFYNTASMTPRAPKSNRPVNVNNRNDHHTHMSTRPTYVKSNSHFPTRKVIRTQKKSELINVSSVGPLKTMKSKSDCSVSAFFKVQKEQFDSPRKVNHYTIKADYANKRNNINANDQPPRYFENLREMENYFFPKKRQPSFLPQIPVEQSRSHDKVKAYIESLRHQKERALSAKSGNSNIKIKSDSGIYMMNGPQDKPFSPMDPISTRIGSSTLVTNRDKFTCTQTSITSFL